MIDPTTLRRQRRDAQDPDMAILEARVQRQLAEEEDEDDGDEEPQDHA